MRKNKKENRRGRGNNFNPLKLQAETQRIYERAEKNRQQEEKWRKIKRRAKILISGMEEIDPAGCLKMVRDFNKSKGASI